MKLSKRISVVLVILVLCLYQAPNLALLAHKGGVSIASPAFLGVEIKVNNGWYPVASSNSILGKAFLPASPSLIAFQRPSLIWPWRGELFAVMSYEKPVDGNIVESVKQTAWGKAMLLKTNPTNDPTQRLFAVPNLGVGILVRDQRVLDDIVMLTQIGQSAKLR